MPDQLDDAVIAAAQRGDSAAFASIWHALAPAVAAYLSARGAEDPDATTSDVFVAVLPRLAKITGGVSGLRTFVFSVAHARLVDELRRRRRRPATVAFDAATHDGVAASAEHEAIVADGSARVQALLDRLAPDHREVLTLRIVADLSIEQAADVMHRSVGAIKQLQRRALLALRCELDRGAGVTGSAVGSITDMS